jgi:hypothetical protein
MAMEALDFELSVSGDSAVGNEINPNFIKGAQKIKADLEARGYDCEFAIANSLNFFFASITRPLLFLGSSPPELLHQRNQDSSCAIREELDRGH